MGRAAKGTFSGASTACMRAAASRAAPRSAISLAGDFPMQAVSRCSQREGTDGASPERAARVSRISGLPIAMAKSCAAWPMRRSGGSSFSPDFMTRDMKPPGSARPGQLPSLRPPHTRRSTLCSRASSATPDRHRLIGALTRLDRLAAISAPSTSGHSVGATRNGACDATRPRSRSASLSPASPR